MRSSNYSNLFLIVFKDYTMEVWDIVKLRCVRKFTSHSNKINDCFFSKDNKFVFSCSQDKTLKIFEVLSGKQINSISLDHAIQTMDISQDGELIATCFENSREINLWHNLVYMRPWGLEGGHVVF